jgi:hypothetical protein
VPELQTAPFSLLYPPSACGGFVIFGFETQKTQSPTLQSYGDGALIFLTLLSVSFTPRPLFHRKGHKRN